MTAHNTERIRNIALVGPAGSGKTTLAEALLAAAGDVEVPGTVEAGTTVCDFDPLEKQHGHSISTAIVGFDHGGVHVNLLDTPGLPDLLGEALCALPAVETVAVVVNAGHGVELVTRRMMDRAADRKICRMIVVNKIDGAEDLPGLLTELQESFGGGCLPINLPANGGASVVHCFARSEGQTDLGSVADAHTALLDQVVELDEDLMAVYLEEGSVSPQALHDSFEAALRAGHLIPVCFVSATTGAGVPELLDIFEHLAPTEREGNPWPFLVGEEKRELVPSGDPNDHVLAEVWRVAHAPFLGKVAMIRVQQGTLRKDSQLFVGDGRKPFKVGHLLQFHGEKHEELDFAVPGDICAVTRADLLDREVVLHDSHDEDDVVVRPVRYPQPTFGLALEPATRTDGQKLGDALRKLLDEDPCLVVEHNEETHEMVLRGLGSLHLRYALEKLESRHNVRVNTRPPRIAYRETISTSANGHHRHRKQTGGAGQFAEVYLRIEPRERGAGYEFVSEVVGGAIPRSYLPAIDKGVRAAMETGVVAGYPVQDVRVVVYDGKHHAVDSKEVAFVAAGKRAFMDAFLKAEPTILEPYVDLEMHVPTDHVGDASGYVGSRRGRIGGSAMRRSGHVKIEASAPMAELGDFGTALKSMTSGAGSFTMEFSHYEPAPPGIQKDLEQAFRPQAAE